MNAPARFTDCSRAVDAILERLGRRISLALPLGLGKPNHLVNELVSRAVDGHIDRLEIFTALSLGVPRADHPLERRLMEPIAERLYGEYEPLDYVDLRAAGKLPDSVRIREFYVAPGELLGDAGAQQDYTSVNYTDVLRQILQIEPDLVMQLVAPGRAGHVDLSCNTDLSLDLFEAVRGEENAPLLAAQVNRRLPAMGGQAEVAEEIFDIVLDDSAYDYELFTLPSFPPTDAEYAIGLRTAALLRDGGTLQVGIGNQGAAVCWAAILRHERPETFARLLDAIGVSPETRRLIERIGGTEPFKEGLYASTEMLVEGILQMFLAGVVDRRVYDDLDEQLAALEGDASDRAGAAIHAGFFLGSERFYELLRELDDSEREAVRMTSVAFTNLLYGQETLKRAQRRHARFINQTMNVTLLGAAASDTLPDGRVVSGVGGQYEFIAMAHALDDGRALLSLESVRGTGDGATSNIVWDHPQVTIPRHLRDIVVTEYGVADLRGKSDREVIESLLAVADSRFQDELAASAKAAGKLSSDYELPEGALENSPERLAEALEPYRRSGDIPRTPFGSALTDIELDLRDALLQIKPLGEELSKKKLPHLEVEHLYDATRPPKGAQPYLERLGLADPEGVKETFFQRLIVYGLSAAGHL